MLGNILFPTSHQACALEILEQHCPQAGKSYEGETGASYEPGSLSPTGSTAGWISYPAISPIPAPPPVRLRAGPLSHRLPLQGGVPEASTRLPVELYHSPLEGESQKPSRMAKADAVGGRRRASQMRPQPARRRLMRWGQGSAPDRATRRVNPVATGVLQISPATPPRVPHRCRKIPWL